MRSFRALRFVAALEALKGLVVLLAGSGLLLLIHQDVHQLAASLLAHAHLNPAAKYPQIFLDAVSGVTDHGLWQLAAGAAAYAALRLVEAYGLFMERAWAEVLAAVSGAVYVPFEVAELFHRPTVLAVLLLVLNLLVVALMVHALQQRRLSRALQQDEA
jgi:uncharacterized membrane protein (DUF2068 family)